MELDSALAHVLYYSHQYSCGLALLAALTLSKMIGDRI